jgi:hypothetical protein
MTPADAILITMATVFGIALAIALIAAIVWSVIWVGKDARSRGIKTVWPLQVLLCLQFPWPLLMYVVVTRLMDKEGSGDVADAV